MSVKRPKITQEEIAKRANHLLTALILVYESDNKTITYGELIKLVEGIPSHKVVLSELFNTHILSKPSGKGKEDTPVKYTGIEPVFIVAKKIIVEVIEKGRGWVETNRIKRNKNKEKDIISTAIATIPAEKMVPLHYNNLLKEIAVLKERYKLTVPNAHVEIIVKISSATTV
jgi:hypothetical protein